MDNIALENHIIVKTNFGEVKVKKLGLGEIAIVSSKLEKLPKIISEISKQKEGEVVENLLSNFNEIIGGAWNDVKEILKICLDIEEEKIDKIHPEYIYEIFQALIKANSFFLDKIKTLVKAGTETQKSEAEKN